MEIYFSRHAKKQMKWRGITEEEVKETILYPEEVKDSIKGRQNACKHSGQKWLKVTFKQESDQIVIITALDKNK